QSFVGQIDGIRRRLAGAQTGPQVLAEQPAGHRKPKQRDSPDKRSSRHRTNFLLDGWCLDLALTTPPLTSHHSTTLVSTISVHLSTASSPSKKSALIRWAHFPRINRLL